MRPQRPVAFCAILLSMSVATPILWMPIYTAGDEDRSYLLDALAVIHRDDPAVLIRTDPHTGELLFSGSSLEHLQDTFNKIGDEDKVPAWRGAPRVRYLETILHPAEAEGKYIRQTGGLGNYGHVKLRLEPANPAGGLNFVNAIQGGVIPPRFIPSVESGIRTAAQTGIVAGHELAGITVTLFDGSFHEVDSNDMAFQIAASVAFNEALKKGRPLILEPIMSVLFTAPQIEQVAVVEDIWKCRGEVTAVEVNSEVASVRATIPLEHLLAHLDAAVHVESFAGWRQKPSRPNPGDPAGIAVPRPRGPSPRNDSAAADPEWDWT